MLSPWRLLQLHHPSLEVDLASECKAVTRSRAHIPMKIMTLNILYTHAYIHGKHAVGERTGSIEGLRGSLFHDARCM